MSRLEAVAARYERSAALLRNGVELDVVVDPLGARVDTAVRQLLSIAGEDASSLWDDVLGAAKALRWRLLTQPQPVASNPSVRQAAADVGAETAKLRPGVGPPAQHALDELAHAAAAAAETNPAAGSVLLEMIQEATAQACVVIAASGPAAAGLEIWLAPLGYRVRTTSQLIREQSFAESGYAAGPPRLFPASLVNAPMTQTLNFVFPAWFADRSVPRSVLASRAEGAVAVTGRQFTVGDTTHSAAAPPDGAAAEDDLLPQARWAPPHAAPREPGTEEVTARQVALSGGYRMWLDDEGEWIRGVDPSQPGGGRVINIAVNTVRPGVYLLLRDGQTEREALYEAALHLLGPQAAAVEASQARWKQALQTRLDQRGVPAAVQELDRAGVKACERVASWTEPMLARPRDDQDFETLLQWLGLPVHPAHDLATALRRARMRASVDVAEQLEAAVGFADMAFLEREGHLRLELDIAGFRGVLATRVLSISPHVEVIPRHDARVAIPDRSAKWLE